MLMCTVSVEDGNPKLIIQPEITDGGEEIVIPITSEQYDMICQLNNLADSRE